MYFFLILFFLIPSSANAQSPENYISDNEKVVQCIQEVYRKESHHEPIENGLMVALKNCYKGTLLESAAQFPTEQKTKLDFSAYKDIFTDPRASLELQKAYDAIPRDLTVEESQKVSSCFSTLQNKTSGSPSAKLQRAFAECFRGTSYEPIALVYEKIATRIDCANEKLGSKRVLEVIAQQNQNDYEIAVVQQCIIERAALGTAGVATLNIIFGLGPTNTGLFLYFLVTQPFLGALMRKKNTWGNVRSSATNRPVDLALVRAIRDGRVVRTRVTDALGRYLFLVEPETYTIEITKPAFSFPSFLTKEKPTFRASRGIINIDVPIDPIVKEKNIFALRFDHFRVTTQKTLANISPLITIAAAFFDPKWWMIGIAAFTTGMFVIFRAKISAPTPSSFGMIIDTTTKKPIANAIVRIFSLPYLKLADSQLSDGRGRYAFLVGPGTYKLTVEKTNYQKTESNEITVAQKEGWIDTIISLKK